VSSEIRPAWTSILVYVTIRFKFSMFYIFWGFLSYRTFSASHLVDVMQIPGSMSQYDSVFHALREIGKNEGLQGLYRYGFPWSADYHFFHKEIVWIVSPYIPTRAGFDSLLLISWSTGLLFITITVICFCILWSAYSYPSNQGIDSKVGHVYVSRSHLLCIIWILQEGILFRCVTT